MDFLSLSVALRKRGYAGQITAGGHFGTFARNEILEGFPEIDSISPYEAEDRRAVLLTCAKRAASCRDRANRAANTLHPGA